MQPNSNSQYDAMLDLRDYHRAMAAACRMLAVSINGLGGRDYRVDAGWHDGKADLIAQAAENLGKRPQAHAAQERPANDA